MADWRPIEDIPTDGTRILVKTYVKVFDSPGSPFKRSGTHIIECWYNDGALRKWCGALTQGSTEHIDPIGWLPSPDAP